MSSVHDPDPVAAVRVLGWLRQEFYRALRARADALFELCDAVVCTDGPVSSLVGLSLAAEHRRGHGALYDGVNHGRMQFDRLRRVLAGVPLPRDTHGRIMLAVDVSNYPRPEAVTSPDRLFCHMRGRGRNAQVVAGWPYSFIAALEPGRSSWTAMLDAVRLGPTDDLTEVTAAQVRDLVTRLIEAGQWTDADPNIVVVFDAGYELTRLAWLLRDLPVEVIGRVRSVQVFHLPPLPRPPGKGGRTPRHGPAIDLDQPEQHPPAALSTVTDTSRYGTATATAWDRTHQRLHGRDAWADHHGELPIVEGTLIRLTVQRLPGNRHPNPVWLWAHTTNPEASDVDRLWQTYLRRFDLEHTFRLFKQTLGWTKPRLRDPAAADRWTWLILIAHTQLRLARDCTTDLRRPWERPTTHPGRLTPNRVRRGFRNLHPKLPNPAGAPKPTRPGPGRPPGTPNKQPTPRPPIGKPHRKRQPTNPKG